MFKSLSFLCLFFTTAAMAQDSQIPTNEKSGEAEYTDVITVDGATAEDLRARAHLWIEEFFPNPKGAVETDDSIAGKIDGKAQFRLEFTDKKGNVVPAGFVRYSYSLEFKEGKYRYVIDRIHFKQSSYYDVSRWENKEDPNYKEEYASFVDQTVEYFNTMLDSLEETMATAIEEESSDW